MIRLIDILEIPEEHYNDYKIHFATGSKERYEQLGREYKKEPYRQFLLGDESFKSWQEFQTKKNFGRKYIISMIYYDEHRWVFGGIYEVLPAEPKRVERDGWKGWRYDTRLVDCQKDLIGRAFIYYHKKYRRSYPNLELKPSKGVAPRDMYIESILDHRVSINDFPGFDNVNIDYDILSKVVSDNISSWKSALSNVKGIYLIVDRLTGKQYVGSAYGTDCLWQRWCAYVKNGHGGNVKLEQLLKDNGNKYKSNFVFSVLEVCNLNLGDEYILSREAHWKNVLMTREFGLNDN